MANDLWSPTRFDRDLIAKYDRPGPRYTSYPTAPQFTADFGSLDHAGLLDRSRERGERALSLYVHVPFCTTRCLFCGCNVTISRDRTWGNRYLPLLAREMEMASALLGGKQREVVQVHWGGGTPTFLPPEDLKELMAFIRRNFRLAEDCEIGVEIDPRECTPEQLDVLAAAGVNRVSLGVQDLNPDVQRAVRREQSPEETWGVLDGVRQRGIASVNMDLIYGLPRQTPESFAATVREVVRMAPDRLALFNFAYLPSMFRHQGAIDPAELPAPEAKLRMLEDATNILLESGYVFIGMDHFARPDDSLARALRERTLTRNFQGYSTCAETDLIGFGVSSISEVADGYAQNAKTMAEYADALMAGRFATARGLAMSADDVLRRRVIMDVMSHFRLDKREVERRFGIDFDRTFGDALKALEPMADDGLVSIGPDVIEVTPMGRFLVRNIAMVFDAYLAEPSVATRYSRTV